MAEQERERLLEQVQAQAAQMDQVMQSVPEGIFLLDALGMIVVANPQAEEYLTLLAKAAVGDTLTELGDVPLTTLLQPPTSGNWHEIRAYEQICELAAQPVQSGPLSQGWAVVLRQVTEQKRMEQQFQRQERMAAIGHLAAGIAYDFNNLMAVILLHAQLIERSSRLLDKERQQAAVIGQQAKRAARLIEQILDFSRRAVFERRPLDLLVILKEEIRLLQRTLPESVEIVLTAEADAYVVLADITRMDGRGTPFPSRAIDFLLHSRALNPLQAVVFDSETMSADQRAAVNLGKDHFRGLSEHRPVVVDFAWR